MNTVAIKVAKNIPNKRVIYTCKCGKVRAYDYQHQDGNLKQFRVEGEQVIWQEQDGRCPECGTRKGKVNFIHAELNENHICDARCLNATGKDCSCSCGGANHGAKYLF